MSSQEDSRTTEDNFYDISYVVDVITKEAPKDEKLVKQVLYAILMQNPMTHINLAVNAPTGQGKSHVVQKVVRSVPKE